MKTMNPLKPRMAADDVISFVLLILFSLAFFLVWYSQRNIPDTSQNVTVIKPAEEMAHADVNHLDTVDIPLPKLLDADLMVPPASHEVREHASAECIAPPLPVYNIRFATSEVNANTGEIISTKGNSQVHIPAHAFVNAAGKVVEGNVKVNYREYHDFRDIFLSGIPMDYDKGMLESAGMIEITAAQNGEQVYVNPENKIRVMLASSYKSNDYNLYFLDQKEKKWKVKGKDEVVMSSKKNILKPVVTFTDSAERKFYFDSPKYRVRIICMSDMHDTKKHWFSRMKSPTIFDFRFGRVDNMPPEMKDICGITWRYYGEDAQDVYMNLFGMDEMQKRTHNAKIVEGIAYIIPDEDAGPGNYRVSLTTENMTMNIPVVPAFSSESSDKNFNKRFGKYYEASNKRRYTEQKRFEKFRADTTEYFVNNARYLKTIANAETVALRTFEIDNFGVWNCDKFYPVVSNTVVAKFIDQNGKRLKITKGYLVEKARNSVYPINDFSYFRFDPQAQNLFWAILPDNKLAVIYPEEFAKHENDKKGFCTFVMKVNENALSDIANLKAALSFN